MKIRLLLPLALGALFFSVVLAFLPKDLEAATLPPPPPRTEAGAGLAAGEMLAGTEEGLWRIGATGEATALWQGGTVKKILRAPRPAAGAEGWYFLSSLGLLYSPDLAAFEQRSAGLPVKTYKRVVNGQKVFEQEIMDLKDLESDPTGRFLVTCTKDSVYLSRDGGLSWEDLGAPNPTTGIKAVALAPFPGGSELGVFASHPIKGLFARKLSPGAAWTPVGSGLLVLPSMTSPEELSDLVLAEPAEGAAGSGPAASPASLNTAPAGPSQGVLWAANSFQGRIYRTAAGSADFTAAWNDGRDFGSAESLAPLPDGSLRFVTQGAIGRLDPRSNAVQTDPAAQALAAAARASLPNRQLQALAWNEGGRSTALSELWLLGQEAMPARRAAATNHHGLYLATGFVINPASRTKYLKLMAQQGINSLVVDVKDDFGRLRFSPRDPLLQKMGKTASVLDVEAFAAEAEAKGIWLVARVVVFKDETLAAYGGGKYAVWDQAEKAPWRGYRTVRKEIPAPSGAPNPYGPSNPPAPTPTVVYEREYNGEHWVDPYSEEVWAYNVAIANEIVARGFDEVQFDYIRFPTDGENIDRASFRWRDKGMDKESALTSFLRFARERIEAPISIDIYGANGWYRSGVRTGQDVELLAKYVDVICPMLYPSHFEQNFLADAPAEERPYRIYRLGTLRNAHIARGKAVIRPYVQAFFLNVSYDRAFYNLDYVKRQVAGVRDAQNLGMTFWNNAGRYDDVPVLEYEKDGRLAGPAGWKGGPQAAGPRPGALLSPIVSSPPAPAMTVTAPPAGSTAAAPDAAEATEASLAKDKAAGILD